MDLAVGEEVKNLIKKAIQTKNCKNVACNSKFTFKNIRYYCESCGRFFCKNCSESQWVYEGRDSEEMERPVCRCQECNAKIKKSEDDLKAAMRTLEYHTVDNVLSQILGNHVDIDVKLKNDAEILHLKL